MSTLPANGRTRRCKRLSASCSGEVLPRPWTRRKRSVDVTWTRDHKKWPHNTANWKQEKAEWTKRLGVPIDSESPDETWLYYLVEHGVEYQKADAAVGAADKSLEHTRQLYESLLRRRQRGDQPLRLFSAAKTRSR